MNGGGKFLYFWYLLPPLFYCIFKKEFSKFILLILAIFFVKFPKTSKILRNFSNFFKIEKIKFFSSYWFKSIYRSKFCQISLQKYKNGQFFLKNCYFSKSLAPSAPKICSFDTQKTWFFVFRVPLRPGSP